ncbi:MAG: RNB domain-containing ribonuclease, partial [Thermoleophilia bacterium]
TRPPARGPVGGAPRPRAGQEERAATVGVVVRRGKYLEIDPLFEKGQSLLVGREGIKPRPGDLVVFSHTHGRRALVTRVVGRADVLRDVLDALLLDKLPARGFDGEVLAEAAAAASGAGGDDSGRVDLRGLFTFTVDPATAKDFDDALSFVAGPTVARPAVAGPEGVASAVAVPAGTGLSSAGTAGADTVTAFVHIADVAYYVQEGGAVDREALRRGTSVYVATGVEPMLPPVLSNSVCSLQPGVERKAVTVEFEVGSADGVVRSVRFYRSLIVSDERLDYDQLEEIFRGERRGSAALTAALELGRPLAAAVRSHRERRGSLQITSAEPDFHWDEQGRVTGAHPAEELESHRFIEDFMVLANEEVAGFLERERVPTVYRVHDLPDPFKLDRLLDLLSSLDLPTPPFSPMTATPEDVRRVMIETAGWIDSSTPRNRGKTALQIQVLRAQSRAVYQTDNIGHFGLSLATYCHFTSPIRRYPDLLVHRGLLARLGAAEPPTTSTLAEWAEQCSVREREASRIELTADDIAVAFLLKQRLDEEGWGRTFQGQIVSFVRSGAFVLFDRLYQGFLPARELPGDYYELDDMEAAMVGKRTGAAYRLADFVDIKVAAVDEARGKVDLVLALD